MINCEELLRQVRKTASGETLRLAENWLSGTEARLVGQKPAEVTVLEAQRLWQLRYTNLLERNTPLEGAEAFLAALSQLNPSHKIVQFSFSSEAFAGSVFFEKASGCFVGLLARDLRTARPVKTEYDRHVQVA